MTPRLFLTGPMGCGKSTAIARGLGSTLPRFGGFLTKRTREPQLEFTLESPDGSCRTPFLTFPGGEPNVDLDVFARAAAVLQGKAPLVLDEIGGIELLCPEFAAALDGLLEGTTPVVGVIKGEGPASALIRRLGLDRDYELAAEALRQRLDNDSQTTVYHCQPFDPHAPELVRAWAKEYGYG